MNVVVETCTAKLASSRDGARRLFHGRGHTYPGYEHLTVTWLPPYLHIAAYADVDDGDIQTLVSALETVAPEMAGVALQQRDGRRTRTRVFCGEVPETHVVREQGLLYEVAPLRNQNIGLFLDMGHVREYLAPAMPGARVLNLFAYTCAFSVAAIAHGADKVVNNDMNRNVLTVGQRNHELNGHDLRKVTMLPHDLFRSWKRVRSLGPYDVIIIDPPTNQRGSFNAEKQYPQVLKRIDDWAAGGARIMACLNSPFLGANFLTDQMNRWCSRADYVQTLPPHPDFPEQNPDRGLKVLEFRYR